MLKRLKTNKFFKEQIKSNDVGMTYNEKLHLKVLSITAGVISIVALFFATLSIGKSTSFAKTNELLMQKIKSDSIVIAHLKAEKENLKAIRSIVSALESDVISESERADKIVDRIDYIEGMTYEEHLYYIIKNKKKKK